MSAFLANLNFPRGVILFSAVASLVLGVMSFVVRAKALELEQQLDVDAPRLVKDVQQSALLLEQLQQTFEDEGIPTLDQADFYIRDVAQQDGVNVGQVDIAPNRDTPARGIVDRQWRITPKEKDRGFARANVSNFFYRLEEKSRKVRVTHLKLAPAGGKALKPDEVGTDRWTFDVTLTARELDTEQKPGS
jgi:hypothetical protein